MTRHNQLRAKFETLWRQVGGDLDWLVEEYQFHPTRRWRLDYACIFLSGPQPLKIGIELDGGTWTGGRHTRGAGFAKDCEKLNAAQLLGWRVFRLTTDMLDTDPLKHLRPIVKLIEAHK